MFLTAVLGLLLLQQQDVFLGDERFDKVITFRSDALVVEDFLKGLSETLEVQLKCTSDIEEDFIIMFAKDIPAREGLKKISEHFGWKWKKENDVFLLHRSEDQKKQEEKERDNQILDVYRGLTDEAKKRYTEPKEISEEIWKQHSEITNKYHHSVKSNIESGEGPSPEIWHAYFQSLEAINPIRYLRDAVMSEMTDELWMELDKNGRMVFAYNPTKAQKKMGIKARQAAEWYVKQMVNKESVQRYQSSGLSQLLRIHELYENPQLSDIANVRLIIKNETPVYDRKMFPMSFVYADIIDKEGRLVVRTWLSMHAIPPSELDAPVEKQIITEGNTDYLNNSFVLTPELENAFEFPKGIENFYSDMYLQYILLESKLGEKRGRWNVTGYIINEIAIAGNFNIILDAYNNLFPRVLRPFPQSSYARILSILGLYQNWQWTVKDRWAMARTENWQLARASSAPKKKLFHLRDQVVRNGGLSLVDLGEFYLNIDDRKAVAAPLNQFTWNSKSHVMSMETYSGIYLLRGIASMNLMEKQQIQRSNRIPLSSLSVNVRSYFNQSLFMAGFEPSSNVLYEYRFNPDYDGEITDENIRTLGVLDNEITQIYPNGLPANAFLNVSINTTPMSGYVCKNAGGAFSELTLNKTRLDYVIDRYKNSNYEVLLAPTDVSMYFIDVHATPFLRVRYQSYVSRISNGHSFNTYERLDPEFKKKLEGGG